MIKGSVQEDITIVNTYALNIGAPQYKRQMLASINEEIAKGKRYGNICICITDSLRYKAETNIPLKSNYTPIKMLKTKIQAALDRATSVPA